VSVRWIRVLSLATLVATYCLIVLGSTVRVTNSGMGCPGWPLCSGRIGPISQFHPLMEQSHRYLTSLVTVLILALAALAWRAGPKARYVRGPALVSVGVIAVQVVLGAITVITNNAPVTVALHLAVGLLFLGIVTVTAVASFIRPEQSWSLLHQPDRLAWVAVAGLFFVLISGSLVVDGGAQSACKSWPACFGSRASGGLVVLQLAHRSMVLIGVTLVVIYLVTLLRKGTVLHTQRLLALSGLVLLAVQIIVGAFDALLGAPAALADVHLALASALWAVVVAVGALSARGTRDRTAPVGFRDVERMDLSTGGREDC
jgi:heme A synthase